MKTYIKIEITETASDKPGAEVHMFNRITEAVKTTEDVKQFLIDRYGRVPAGKRKVYQDTKEGAKVVGFLHSFWNRDISHNSQSWWQTDWVTFSDVQEKPLIINS
jgi:hypothetical protein